MSADDAKIFTEMGKKLAALETDLKSFLKV